ncbi:hypothetical protein GCM10010330_80250 [Streptomyces tendae]|nr:hypothetical protein GCM10010330_80250 [Streptomyces tendae]
MRWLEITTTGRSSLGEQAPGDGLLVPVRDLVDVRRGAGAGGRAALPPPHHIDAGHQPGQVPRELGDGVLCSATGGGDPGEYDVRNHWLSPH